MRGLIAVLAATVLAAGCVHRSAPRSPATETRPVITPDLRPMGRVEMVNAQARFVVLSFEAGEMPSPGQILSIDHKGLKIGEVKVTGPAHGTDTVADITLGDANVGDQAIAQ